MQPINSITQLLPYVKQGDIVFLDIDETALMPGPDKYQDQAQPFRDTVETINYLQRINIPVFLITSRYGEDETVRATTHQQLNSLGIEPSKLPESALSFQLNTSEKHWYDQGILYAQTMDNKPQKGQVLKEFLSHLPHMPRRVLVLDDNSTELQAIQSETPSQDVHSPEIMLFHHQPHQPSLKGFPHTNPKLPSDLTSLTLVGYMNGAGGGVYVFQDQQTSTKYTLKNGNFSYQMKDEILADGIYRCLGVNVPDFAVFETLPKSLADQLGLPRTGPFRLAEYIEPSPEMPETPQIKDRLSSAFVIDALIGNFDIAGKEVYNNIIIQQDGTIYRVDNGATLRFHAAGEYQKPTSIVQAIDDLRHFYNVSDEAIRDQVWQLLNNKAQLEQALYQLNRQLGLEKGDEMVQLYLDRVAYLKDRFCPDYPLELPHHPAEPEYTAAGTLIYAPDPETNQKCLLLGQRAGHQWWGNLGGKSDAPDPDLAYTAARETEEESMELITVDAETLTYKPYQDLVSHDEQGKPYVYRMYIMEHDYIDPKQLEKRLQECTSAEQQEYSRFTWVSLQALNEGLNNPVWDWQEGHQVAYITANGEQLALHPPFYRMLAQKDVQADLKALQNDEPLKRDHKGSLLRPSLLKQQVIDQFIKKSAVLKELKQNNTSSGKVNPHSGTQHHNAHSVEGYPPSYIHLRAVLGNDIQPDNHRENVKRFLKQSELYQKITSDGDESRVIDHFASMLEAEQAASKNHQTAIYHAADGTVAFLYDFLTLLRQYLQVLPENQTRAFRMFDKYTRMYSHVTEAVMP